MVKRWLDNNATSIPSFRSKFGKGNYGMQLRCKLFPKKILIWRSANGTPSKYRMENFKTVVSLSEPRLLNPRADTSGIFWELPEMHPTAPELKFL